MKTAETVYVYNARPENVRELMKSAGNTIASVHFLKRKDGSLRKMSYRLHVNNPSVAKAPKMKNDKSTGVDASGNKFINFGKGFGLSTKDIDLNNDQLRVLDANKVVKDENGAVVGRGAWRMVPLENVLQITCKGTKYVIKK